MHVSDLKDKSPVDELTLTIESVGDTRDTSFGRVQSTIAKDDTGEVTLSLWNEQVGKYVVGNVVLLKNGWCKEFREQLQVSSGKFGTIEKVDDIRPAAGPVSRQVDGSV